MLDLIIKNGKIVNEDSTINGDIAIMDGKIAAVGSAAYFTEAKKIVDATGKLCMPGLIDSHVHIGLNMGEFATTDTMENATISAAYGGTTSMVEFAMPVGEERPLEAMKKTQAITHGHSVINYSFHGCITRNNEQSLSDLRDMLTGGIPSIKMFSIYKETVMLESLGIHRALEVITQKNGVALIHAENAPYIEALIAKYTGEGCTTPYYHMLSRPPISETMEVAKLVPLLELTSTPAIFVHMTSSMVRDTIAYAKRKGLPVYTELCPHYLTLSEEVFSRKNAENFVCSPPMRSEEDIRKMWNMINEGLSDIINSDHSAFVLAQKQKYKGFFPKMPNGLPGIETRGPVMFSEGVAKKRINENDFVRMLSSNTARLMGMYPDKGRIAPGTDADIVIVDPSAEYVMSISNLHMQTDYTPFEGLKMTGKFTDTVIGGKMVIENGTYTGEVNGREIMRHAPDLY
jgi:dihydropyrimidinase